MANYTNPALVYKSTLYDVKKKIRDIEACGINTDKYKETLKSIANNLENNVKTNSKQDKNISSMFLELDYTRGINELKQLERVLDNFMLYVRAYNTSCLAQIKLDSENITSVEVNTIVDKILEMLKQIKNGTYFNKDVECIENKFFEVVYNLIKLEVAVNGCSRLYDYSKNYNEELYFINKYLNKDISKLDLNDSKYTKLKERIYELNSDDIKDNDFDLEVIKLLLSFDNNCSIKNNCVMKLEGIISELDLSRSKIKNRAIKLEKVKKKLELAKEEYSKSVRNLFLRSGCALLTVSTIVGSAFAIHAGVKKVKGKDCYKRTITTYSEWNGLNTTEDLIEVKNFGGYENKTYLRVYGLWEEYYDYSLRMNCYKRNVKEYDLSNYNFDNIEEYVTRDIDSFNVTYNEYEQAETSVSQLYTNEITEVEKSYIDTSNVLENFNNKDYKMGLISAYLFYISILYWIFDRSRSGYNYLWCCFSKMKDYINEFFENKKLKEEQLIRLQNIVSEILTLVNNNEELKLEFNRLYNENIYLLDSPDELYNSFKLATSNIDALDINTKKLIKGKN